MATNNTQFGIKCPDPTKSNHIQQEMLHLFSSFCKHMGTRLPQEEFRRKGIELIKSLSWEGTPRDLVSGLIYYLKRQIFEFGYEYLECTPEGDGLTTRFWSYTIPPPILAQLFDCDQAGIERCYQDLLTRCGVHILEGNSAEIIARVAAPYKALIQVSPSAPPSIRRRKKVLCAILVCFQRHFGVEPEEYHPQFLKWLLSREFWDADWKQVYWYLTEYLYDASSCWVIWEYMLVFEDRLEFAIDIPWERRYQIRAEVDEWIQWKLESIIAQVLQQGGVNPTKEVMVRYLRLFRRYCNQINLEIPPWSEHDLPFYETERERIDRILEQLQTEHIQHRGRELRWLASFYKKDTWSWYTEPGRLYPGDYEYRVITYFSHSKRLQGTDRGREELEMIQAQLPHYMRVTNPAEFKWEELRIPYGPEMMEYCLAYIQEHVEILFFSEFQGFVGRGTYLEIQAARQKGIPIFLIRDGKFWLNPVLEIFDEGDWAVEYAKVSTLPFPPLKRLSELLRLR